MTQPVVTDAGIFVASSTDSLYLIDDDSGADVWTFEPGYTLSGISANIATDGRQLVFVTNAGRIVSLVVPSPSAEWTKEHAVLPRSTENE